MGFNWISKQGTTTTATNTTTSKGANVITAGDLLVVLIVLNNSVAADPGAVTAPDGTWTQAFQAVQGNGAIPEATRLAVFYKIAGASESGAYQFSWTSSVVSNYSLLDYGNVIAVSPGDAFQHSEAADNATAIISPSISPAGTTDIFIGIGYTDGTTWSSNFVGLNSRQLDSAINGTRVSVAIGDLQLLASGATGTFTATAGAAAVWITAAMTFKAVIPRVFNVAIKVYN